ncbi:MAG: DUF1572 domain-containing protein [Eudoraea sp.]|nr:DUF1572 domain-containing protein [Eudoraea sp.]
MSMENKAIQAFTESLIFRLDEKTEMIAKCLHQLSEEELWQRPNQASNSVGNLLLHLCGNIRQYMISGLGKQDDIRERDLEFNISGGYTKAALFEKLDGVLEETKAVVNALDNEAWLSEYQVQGFKLSGIGIALHVVEHYAYHTGQIAFWTKLLKAEDLGFYEGMDLNTKND